jgi:hypothetical protein
MSSFGVPERAPTGWVQKDVAEQTIFQGGLGVPNIYSELKALSVMVVGEWALATDPQQQRIGEVLQQRDRSSSEHVMPGRRKIGRG